MISEETEDGVPEGGCPNYPYFEPWWAEASHELLGWEYKDHELELNSICKEMMQNS